MIQRISDISVTPSRPGMGRINFILSLWNDGDTTTGDPTVTQQLSQETKIASEGITAESMATRYESLLEDYVNGWTDEYKYGHDAARAITPFVVAAADKITGV